MDSSWPVRGIAGEFRYNLVLEAGHQWIVPGDERLHPPQPLRRRRQRRRRDHRLLRRRRPASRTTRSTGARRARCARPSTGRTGQTTLKSNAFIDLPTWTERAVVDVTGGTIDADYNGFFNPQTTNYTRRRRAGARPPRRRADRPEIRRSAAETRRSTWTAWRSGSARCRSARSSGTYRARYTPTQGSPYIDAGDPGGWRGQRRRRGRRRRRQRRRPLRKLRPQRMDTAADASEPIGECTS